MCTFFNINIIICILGSLTRIKKTFSECYKSIKCVECLECDKDQKGGSIYKVTYYENKLKEIYDQINISCIL